VTLARRSLAWTLGIAIAGSALVWGPRARAEGAADSPKGRLTADRTAVRFVTPETGGSAQPRWITDRELALFARLEAMMEHAQLVGDEYPERYVRVATDRLIARAMLASLMIQRGLEPPELPKLAEDARSELADRVGGAAALEAAMKREGIEDDELAAFLRDEVRAAFYIDRGITPIFSITEDALREAFRSALHPYHNLKFEDARVRLKRWVVAERERAPWRNSISAAATRASTTRRT
jgi:hypothetical protein